ncbi:poly-beta-1,6-N-acetyl-D-glucosamine biosynthesis protein PgaD [Corticibacter populi]|uniref:poly-beta-1,6-N-acetyl-D-glucosamine biosynthesis protein PgaD n=1 Tax=Corticibacter populi TaxID=1550736 RepID=UPI0013C30E7A|nr:poly-beta-1,6-N-acetyl-D-glucosamine biosynthesis protein PgaD [Corticibacter populi]
MSAAAAARASTARRSTATPPALVWHHGQCPVLPHQPAQSIILRPRKGSPRHLVELFITALLWLAFIYLCLAYLGKRSLQELPGWRDFGLDFATSILIIAVLYLATLAAGAIVMGIWAACNKFLALRRPASAPAPSLEERRIMRAFEVSRTMFDRLQQGNVVTMFHDAHGEIESIRAGCQIPENGETLSQLPPDSFYPTQWDSAFEDDAPRLMPS